MLKIIKAQLEDLPALVEMGGKFFAEAGWDKITDWHSPSAHDALHQLILSDIGLVLVAKDGTDVVGMAGAITVPLWFNPEVKMTQELFWYVKPEQRKGVGKKFLDAFESAAIAQDATAMTMMSVAQLNSLDDFYMRCGYRASEKTFIKRLQ